MTNESTRPALEQKVFDAETFRTWQSELNEFIELTQQRLQTLSQSCSQCRREQETFSPEVRETPTHCETARSTQFDGDPPSAAINETNPPAEQPTAPATVAPATVAPATVAPANDFADEDPLERLNAIKRRLASQMQSAS